MQTNLLKLFWGKSRCLLREPYETHEFTMWSNAEVGILKREVHIVTAGLWRVKGLSWGTPQSYIESPTTDTTICRFITWRFCRSLPQIVAICSPASHKLTMSESEAFTRHSHCGVGTRTFISAGLLGLNVPNRGRVETPTNSFTLFCARADQR
jgi:hypothetical protein